MKATDRSVAIGSKLKEAREYLGMTQEYASHRVGVLRPALTLMERGKQVVPAELLLTLAELYKRDVGWFLGEKVIAPTLPRSFMRDLDRLSEHDRDTVLKFASFLANIPKSGG